MGLARQAGGIKRRQGNRALNFREVILQRLGHRMRGPRLRVIVFPGKAIEIFRFVMKAVVAQLSLEIEYDEENAGNSKGKTENIDDSVCLALQHAAHGDD